MARLDAVASAMTPAARRLSRGALDLVFPPRCLGCASAGSFLCGTCAGSLQRAGPPRCSRCWRVGPWSEVCFRCRMEPPPFAALRAAFVYDGLARELVHALKFQGMTALAEPMAGQMAHAVRADGLEASLIVPVPLSGLRKRLRGYNQAGELARALGRELGVAVSPRALRRTRHTSPQARSASSEERRRNVAGAFEARPEATGQRIVVVDDVTTTGATLAACCRAVDQAGARSVWALAFARED